MAKNYRVWWRKLFPTAHKILLSRKLNAAYPSVTGKVLVVGAGREQYKTLLKGAEEVVLTDVVAAGDDIDEIADAHSLPYEDCTFDCIIASEVFEHLERPLRASQEIFRVLNSGGKAIVSIPFMFRVHGDPYDYQRLTKAGIEVCFGQFSRVKVFPFGNRAHVLSDIVTTSSRAFFPLRSINWLLCVASVGDRPSIDCPSGFFVELWKDS